MTDEYPESEREIERLWKEQKGVDPKTGRMWLTPRMKRNAQALEKAWEKEKAGPYRKHMWMDGECAVCGYPPDSPEGREPCAGAGGQQP